MQQYSGGKKKVLLFLSKGKLGFSETIQQSLMRKLVRLKNESYLVFGVGFCDFLGGCLVHFWQMNLDDRKVFEVWFFSDFGTQIQLVSLAE